MPKSFKYICFKHRHSTKKSGLCPTCRVKLYCVGSRVPIPRKTNDAGWKSLLLFLQKTRNFDSKINRSAGVLSWTERFKREESNNIGKKEK